MNIAAGLGRWILLLRGTWTRYVAARLRRILMLGLLPISRLRVLLQALSLERLALPVGWIRRLWMPRCNVNMQYLNDHLEFARTHVEVGCTTWLNSGDGSIRSRSPSFIYSKHGLNGRTATSWLCKPQPVAKWSMPRNQIIAFEAQACCATSKSLRLTESPLG